MGAASVLGGKEQLVNVNGQTPSNFIVDEDYSLVPMIGFSIFRSPQDEGSPFSLGLGGFYIARSDVSGEIYQATLFNNLGYKYQLQNTALYLLGRAQPTPKLSVDVGIGPNYSVISNYSEWLINPSSATDDAFGGNKTIKLSATLGVDVYEQSLFGKAAMRCGYRFFYLGSNALARNNNQYLTHLSTGHNYANALTCSTTLS